ncbi:MAG: hypothetical protein ACI9JR_003004, partial [Gammaproteobacteria bacterium]
LPGSLMVVLAITLLLKQDATICYSEKNIPPHKIT